MQKQTTKVATVQTTGEFVQTDATPAQPQPHTAPDGATAATAIAVGSAEVTATKSQSIAAATTRKATQAPADGTSAPAEVPNSHLPAVLTPIEPLPANEALTFLGVKPDVKDMTLDEKFACLKQCFAYGYGVRKVLCQVFESIRDEFKTYEKNRAGMPTVEEAFKRRGLNYKTVYSVVQREKERRAEDAQFFAAIKAQASGKDSQRLDLPPIGEKVVLGNGRKGMVLTQSMTDGGKSAEVCFDDDGTTEIVKANDVVSLASIKKAKAQAKVAKGTARITGATEKALFPSFKGTEWLTNLIAFLSADAVGRVSPLKAVFGELCKDKFRDRVVTFAQRICDLFFEGEFVVTVSNRISGETKAAPAPTPYNQPPIANVGSETGVTPHGFFAKLTKEVDFGTPWHVFQVGGNKLPLAFAKNRQDAEFQAAKLDRQFLTDTQNKKTAKAA